MKQGNDPENMKGGTELTASPLKSHPAALIYPPMSAAEEKALAEDIKRHGLLDPVTVSGGQIVDGRARARAAKTAGRPIKTEALPKGVSVDDLLLARHRRRKRITQSQWACIAALYAKTGAKLPPKGKLAVNLADRFGVAARYVKYALKLYRRNRDAFDRVWRGEEKLLAALAPYESKAGRRETPQPRPRIEAPQALTNAPLWASAVGDQLVGVIQAYREQVTIEGGDDKRDGYFELWLEESLGSDPFIREVLADLRAISNRKGRIAA